MSTLNNYEEENVLSSIATAAQSCDVVFSWFAQSEEEYNRGSSLGIITGWQNWKEYKSATDKRWGYVCSHCPENILFMKISATPDEIVQRMRKENVPLGRQVQVYQLMGMEMLLNKKVREGYFRTRCSVK